MYIYIGIHTYIYVYIYVIRVYIFIRSQYDPSSIFWPKIDCFRYFFA